MLTNPIKAMILTKPLCQNHNRIVNQVLALMLTNRPFDADIVSSKSHRWTVESVSEVLRSVPRFFFQSPRSIGRQKGFRHRSPMRQRSRKKESERLKNDLLVLGPAAYRNPRAVSLGLDKATEFYLWVEGSFGFAHTERTCRAMALVLARGNRLRSLWDFLREMSRREGGERFVTTSTVTCLIKVLGEEGLVKEAVTLFYRMRQLRCKPDVLAYNTVINALCLVGNFEKAKFLLRQMELPGFRCPPDVCTYTILISSFCRHSLRKPGCRKAVRRRIWEANWFFREILARGFTPDVVAYNSLINGCVKTHRIGRALELFNEMTEKGFCNPNRVTYCSFIAYYSRVNEVDKAVEMLRTMVAMNHGTPSSSCYTPIIHSLCESGRVSEARDFLDELVHGGSVPREYTYRLVCEKVESGSIDQSLQKRIEDGIKERFDRVGKFKPVMNRSGYDLKS